MIIPKKVQKHEKYKEVVEPLIQSGRIVRFGRVGTEIAVVIKDKYIGVEWSIRLSRLPETQQELEEYFPHKWVQIYEVKLTQEQFFEVNLQIHNKQLYDLIKQGQEEGLISKKYWILKGTVNPIIIDQYIGAEWQVQIHQMPQTLEELKLYFPRSWHRSYQELVDRQLFRQALLMKLGKWQVVKQAQELGVVKKEYFETPKNLYIQVQDRASDILWQVKFNEIPDTLEELIDYMPYRYDPVMLKEYGLTREDLFKLSLKHKDLHELWQQAWDEKLILDEYQYIGTNTFTKILVKELNVYISINVSRVPQTLDGIRQFYPLRWGKQLEELGVDRQEFIWGFIKLKNPDKFQLLKQAKEEGLFKEFVPIAGCTSHGLHIVNAHGDFKVQPQHCPLTLEEFRYVGDRSLHVNFIEPYDKSKEFMKSSEFSLRIYKNPIVLTLRNFVRLTNNKSIVTDLYSPSLDKSIYVMECRDGYFEQEALELYIKHDNNKTKKRRSDWYGYSDNQPIVDKIWQYNDFIVRLLATGKVDDSQSVRAYESVWNTECNDNMGCLIKQ